MRIHHIATSADWSAARRSGRYDTSTRGRTLAQEGFIHAARPEQVRGVFDSFYADAEEPLVLLTIDTDRLDRLGVPWREDPVGDQTFPHLYAALPPAAVVAAQPLGPRGTTPSFLSLFVGEMVWRICLAVLVMVVSGVAGVSAAAVWGERATLPGALAGLVLGAALALAVARRRG